MAARAKRAEVVGYKNVQYTRKNTGEVVAGQEVYVQFELDDVQGFCVCPVWVGKKDLPQGRSGFDVGDTLRIVYDDFRRSGSYLPED